MTVHIVTDSTADLSPHEVDSLGITVVPLTLFFGEQAFLDGVELTAPEFYERLRASKALPRTSQPSVGKFREAYERLAADGATEIVSIHVSSKLSGTANSARLAASEPPPHCRIVTVDGLTVAGGLAAVVCRAAEVAAAGGSADDAAAAARAQIPAHQISILLDTLEYLQRGGRIGKAKAWMGGMLNIKPIIRVMDGEVGLGERVRSRSRGMDSLVAAAAAQPDIERVIIQHSGSPADAGLLVGRIRERLPDVPIDVRWIGSVVGVYTGPNGIGTVTVQRIKPGG